MKRCDAYKNKKGVNPPAPYREIDNRGRPAPSVIKKTKYSSLKPAPAVERVNGSAATIKQNGVELVSKKDPQESNRTFWLELKIAILIENT
uniref:Uncharacterized protein n=1 Tax=Romanomermis culicivorax TaxID=13658 RepID=A0A915K560_ROMCU